VSTTDPANTGAVFKAYDVRGTVPDQVDETLARRTGGAFVEVVGATKVVVGHDMRPSSPGLASAFAAGAADAGADVVMIGLASTDQLYFASGHLGCPGAMFTASHNPAQYNGIKLCREGAQPIGADTGLHAIRDAVSGPEPTPVRHPGEISHQDVLGAYADHLLALAPVTGRRLTVVVDAGNGMAGLTAPVVLERVKPGVDLVPLYFELDGTFPHHEANPIDPANLVDLQQRVLAEGADLGLAFDGDADRCFVVDADGEPVSPSAITGLVATREIARARAGGDDDVAVVHNVISSAAVAEIVREAGARPVRTRVGHSFIKAEMARHGAVFGGEHSAHYYFRDFWFADTGMLAALHVLAALGEQERPLSQVCERFERYVASGEINSTVSDQQGVIERIHAWASVHGARTDELDGLTISYPEGAHPMWWFNVRASNTEPLLRLNVEAGDRETMERLRDELLALIRADRDPVPTTDRPDGGEAP
jgi:phosphomannomutase